MKKKKKTPKPGKSSVLDSPNWISESSAQSPSGDGSGSPDPDCEGCHIDFLEDEVTTDWSEGGTYPASDNLDTGGDAWYPDFWELEVIAGGDASSASETDATIDSDTGVVTFGSTGQSLKITASVKRCVLCKKPMKLHVAQLAIMHNKTTNITEKDITVYAGETVALSGTVLGSKSTGSDWQWTVGGDILKNFKVSDDKHTGERIEYDAEAWMQQKFALHWADGNPQGLPKSVTLKATVNGMPLTASTTVKVKKPDGVFTASVGNPQIAKSAVSGEWGGTVDVKFTNEINAMGGKFQWVQVGTGETLTKYTNGTNVIDSPSGLDACEYPYSTAGVAVDHPGFGFNDSMASKKFELDLTMWLMWRHGPKDVWVSIASCRWWFKGTMVRDPANPAKPKWKPNTNPEADKEAPKENSGYPDWSSCLIFK